MSDVRLQEGYTALTKLSFAYKLVAILSHPLCKANYNDSPSQKMVSIYFPHLFLLNIHLLYQKSYIPNQVHA